MSGFYSQKYGWIDPVATHQRQIDELKVLLEDDSYPEEIQEARRKHIASLEHEIRIHERDSK